MVKIKTIDINAKEWFDRINGNSYFSTVITLNYGMKNSKEIKLAFQYGYDDSYIEVAKKYLFDNGILINKEDYIPSIWRFCQENNIILRTVKYENCLKREL